MTKILTCLTLSVLIDLKGVGASACQKSSLKKDFLTTGGYFFLDKNAKNFRQDAKRGTASKEWCFLTC